MLQFRECLHEALEHHIKEEERNLFHELGEHFADEEREAMGVQFPRGEDKLLKQKAHKTARAPVAREREHARQAAT